MKKWRFFLPVLVLLAASFVLPQLLLRREQDAALHKLYPAPAAPSLANTDSMVDKLGLMRQSEYLQSYRSESLSQQPEPALAQLELLMESGALPRSFAALLEGVVCRDLLPAYYIDPGSGRTLPVYLYALEGPVPMQLQLDRQTGKLLRLQLYLSPQAAGELARSCGPESLQAWADYYGLSCRAQSAPEAGKAPDESPGPQALLLSDFLDQAGGSVPWALFYEPMEQSLIWGVPAGELSHTAEAPQLGEEEIF